MARYSNEEVTCKVSWQEVAERCWYWPEFRSSSPFLDFLQLDSCARLRISFKRFLLWGCKMIIWLGVILKIHESMVILLVSDIKLFSISSCGDDFLLLDQRRNNKLARLVGLTDDREGNMGFDLSLGSMQKTLIVKVSFFSHVSLLFSFVFSRKKITKKHRLRFYEQVGKIFQQKLLL